MTPESIVSTILSELRHIPAHDEDMHHGVWKKRMGSLLSGKRVHLTAKIRGLKKILKAFKVKFTAKDPDIVITAKGLWIG